MVIHRNGKKNQPAEQQKARHGAGPEAVQLPSWTRHLELNQRRPARRDTNRRIKRVSLHIDGNSGGSNIILAGGRFAAPAKKAPRPKKAKSDLPPCDPAWVAANKSAMKTGQVPPDFARQFKTFEKRVPKAAKARVVVAVKATRKPTVARQSRRRAGVPSAAKAAPSSDGDPAPRPRLSVYVACPMVLYQSETHAAGMDFAAGLYPGHELIDVSCGLYQSGAHFLATFRGNVTPCTEFAVITDSTQIVGKGVFEEWQHFKKVHLKATPIAIVVLSGGAIQSGKIQDLAIIGGGRDWKQFAKIEIREIGSRHLNGK